MHVCNDSLLFFSASVLGSQSMQQIFLLEISKYIPTRLLEYMLENASNSRCVRVRGMRDTIVGVVKELIKERAQDLLQGNSDHDDDVLSSLGKTPLYPGYQMT